ncbi:MAG: hypothetical protein HYR62_03980 [Actinobacteria bacterium]|nr:hypothetical protein [Actinomycetota bacterium]MBI3686676.1 hypothetical protein [Actinomycetota bacterium]
MIGAVAFAMATGGYPSFSPEAEVGVALPCIVMLGIVVFSPPERRPAPRRIPAVGWVAWSVPVVVFSALELVNSLGFDSAPEHPTWSVLMDPVLAWPPARMVAIFLWLVAGWELVRR